MIYIEQRPCLVSARLDAMARDLFGNIQFSAGGGSGLGKK